MEEQEFNEEYKLRLFEEFYSSLPENFQSEGIRSQLWSGYDFAYEAHKGVRRKGGNHDPYITHPVSVAQIVANEIGLGVSAVMAALLHDVVEDTSFTYDDIKFHFGENIANIVDGVTKITKKYNAEQNTQAETFKKMLLSTLHDPRVAFVKIADRLHNMRTIEDMPDGTRQIKAGENLYVYVSIAHQLGLYDIKNELEDLSFKYAHPLDYKEMVNNVESTAHQREELLSSFKLNLLRVLVKTGITCKLSVVTKSLFHTWSKMRSGKSFNEINNYQSVRIVFTPPNDYTDDSDDSDKVFELYYKLYASVIRTFPEKIDRRRDYVSSPQKSGFRALVFQVMFGGNWIEVQILTDEDDMVARRGYSLKHATRKGMDLLRQNLSSINLDEEAVSLMIRFQSLAIFSMIYVFTPKGDIVELPSKSTVLDLAFAIHEKMGQHCLGASIEQNIVPINYVLKNSEQVFLITSPSTKPNPQWLNYVVTDKAKQWLDAYFKQDIEILIKDTKLGEQLFNHILKDIKIRPFPALTGRLIMHYGCLSTEEFYQNIARSVIEKDDLILTTKRIKKILDGDFQPPTPTPSLPKTAPHSMRIVTINSKIPLLIDDSVQFTYILCSCCGPIPGDDCLACCDSAGVVFIHRRECVNARKLYATKGKQTTKVEWGTLLSTNPVSINIQGVDRAGVLKDIVSMIDDLGISIKSVNMSENGTGVFGGTMTLMVKNTAQLEEVLKQLNEVKEIVRRNRINLTER